MDYNEIAEQYRESKQLPFRRHIEEHTLFEIIGDAAGKSVLDLACGEGIYARKLRRSGARVVGVDLSEAMLALGRAEEQREPLGIDYVLGDVASLGWIGSFDLVIGSYLLNYARTREQLLQFCQTIHKNLVEGGRFIGINNNPAHPPDLYASSRKYGFIKSGATPQREGDIVRYTNFIGGAELSLDNYYLSKETHEWAFQTAGFRWFEWRPLQVSGEGVRSMGAEFWRDLLEHRPFIGLEAAR